ncbi:MAG: hypothetical protein K9M57_07340, partial [Phycisphaerae bacterium]|nr:hypothetical protein [Phycisphaerae bacterium]
MAVLMGIDEAGYGPLLGPLVVSGAAFEVPDDLIATPIWDILGQSVCKNRKGSRGRIVINDSKKLHDKSGKQNHLQRGTLGCLMNAVDQAKSGKSASASALSKLPGTLGELLSIMDAPIFDELEHYPWYRDSAIVEPLPCNPDDIEIAAIALRNDLKNNNLQVLGLWSRPLPVGRYNDLVGVMNNKASVLFHLASELIYIAWQKYSSQNLNIVIDKQGGRSHYRGKLQKMFPEAQMKILKETETTSSYHLTDSGREMKIHFLAKGDQRQLPIALASMASKYIREMLMGLLNRWF